MGRKKTHKEYFNVFYPSSDVTDYPRFFFFETLTHRNYKTTDPALLGNIIQDKIQTYLNNLNSIQTNGGLSIVQNALNFLNAIIESSYQDEKEWLNRHIQNNSNIPLSLKQQIQSFITNESSKNSFSVDYLALIEFYNKFLLGIDNYSKILNYESQRLKDLQGVWDDFHKAMQNEEYYNLLRNKLQQNKPDLFDPERRNSKTENDIIQNMFFEFVQDHYRDDQTKDMRKIIKKQALPNLIANRVKASFRELWESYNRTKITIKKVDANHISIEDPFMFFALLTEFFQNKISDIIDYAFEQATSIKTTQNRRTTMKRLKDEFLSIIERLDKESVNNSTNMNNNSNDELLRNLIILRDSLSKSANTLHTIQERAFEKSGLPNFRIDNLLEGQRASASNLPVELLIEINKTLEPLIQQTREKNKRLKGLQDWDKASTKLSTIISSKLDWLMTHGNLQQLASAVGLTQESLTTIKDQYKTETRRGLKALAEIIQSGGYVYYKIKSGATSFVSETISNQDFIIANADLVSKGFSSISTYTQASSKSDIHSIELRDLDITQFINPSFFQDIADIICQSLLDTFNSNSSNQTSTSTSFSHELQEELNNLNEEMQKERKKQKIQPNEYSLEIETKTRLKRMEAIYNELKRVAEQEANSAEAIEYAAQQLLDRFQVSTSAKSYDLEYDKQRGGFHGGSLGGSVEQQISNIVYMFDIGGIKNIDKDFLIFAVYNVGPGMVGAESRDALEEFLSIFAVTLLFSDAGEQATYIRQKLDGIQSNTGSHFLHLYAINGLYVPASYVLKLTYDHLMYFYNLLEDIADAPESGSRVQIYNPITIDDMVTTNHHEREQERIQEIGYKVVTSQNDWGATFKANKEAVSCNIVFLAGFLDLLEQLRNNLSSTS